MKSLIMVFNLMTVLCLAGCNGVAGPEHGDPYLVLKGKITNESQVETPENTRVALLWINENPDPLKPHSILKVSQETEINSEFPSFFQLSVNELPPAAAMMVLSELEDELPEGRSVALGAIVVYHDGNDNNELDLLEEEATESADTVLGSPEGLLVVYLEGEPFEIEDEGNTLRVESGFNLLQLSNETAENVCRLANEACEQQAANLDEIDVCFDDLTDCLDEVSAQNPPVSLPLDSEIIINLTSDPHLTSMLCQASGLEGSGGSGPEHFRFDPSDPSTFDPDNWPEGMQIFCKEDGLEFEYHYAVDQGTLCYDSEIAGSGSMAWREGETLPDFWPCEVP